MMESIFDNVSIAPVTMISPLEWAGADSSSDSQDCPAVVRHPFLVVEGDENELLLLDQADAFHHLVACGVAHVPVQHCHRDVVQLDRERLVLTGFGRHDLDRLIAAHPDQLMLTAGQTAPEGCVSLMLEFVGGQSVTVLGRHSSRLGCPASLDLLFRAVLGRGQYYHTMDSHYRPGSSFKVHPPTAWLTLPELTLADLFSAAASDHRFPPGVIRVRTPYRVFNVDFPVPVLMADLPIEEKEAFLRDLILYREQRCRTAFFNGPVYILNR